ncbi:amidohydrolase family protein [bacterium]|nr:amidohydrolase family protein [bacterium]
MFALFFLLLSSPAFSETIAITNAKIYTMAGPVIEKGTVLMRDGKIQEVGSNVSVPADSRVIDASGKSVFPGFIDANCHIGLSEVTQVTATVDSSESVDPVTPQMRVTDAFFPESFAIGVTRSNGVVAGIVSPADENVFAGMSSLIEFSGKRIDEVVLKPVTALHVTMGEAPKAKYGEANKAPSTRMGTAALIRQTLVKAREYEEQWKRYEKKKSEKKPKDEDKSPERDMKLDAVLDVLAGKIPLVVSAHRVDDILTAIRIAEEFGIKKNLVINHGTNAYKIADILAREKIPVILGPVTTQPDSMETLGANYESAMQLHKAGVLIAIQSNETHNARNLPYEAALAVANGLPYEEALKAITTNVAKIFRFDQTAGTIEAGKRANVIVAEGDPLEPRTRISNVFIGGQEITEPNYHEQLYEEMN